MAARREPSTRIRSRIVSEIQPSIRGANGSPHRVAVVFGGTSSEHGVSCLTAAGVLSALDRDRFDVDRRRDHAHRALDTG